MSKSVQATLIILGALSLGAVLLLVGVSLGRSQSPWILQSEAVAPSDQLIVPGGMMSSFGMMSGYGNMGQRGMMSGYGMMGFNDAALLGVDPLSIETSRETVERYLASLGNEDLVVGEVMVFDNHSYAQVVEASSGIGAFEVLVDPVTLAVTPEHGPTMMWNLKYSPMMGFQGFGMMSMMTGGFDESMQGMMSAETGGIDLPLTEAQAIESAQRYLDVFLPGSEADAHADRFYGYYTLHILRDGGTSGMLSVNGYTGEVFVHAWHGNLVEMDEG